MKYIIIALMLCQCILPTLALARPAPASVQEKVDNSSSAIRTPNGGNQFRTCDSMTENELAVLQKLESAYLESVKIEALTLVTIHFDIQTIMRTFVEQIRIIRQRQRDRLFIVQRYLYSLQLNPEFVEAYVDRLEDDAVWYSLDAIIKKSNHIGGRG